MFHVVLATEHVSIGITHNQQQAKYFSYVSDELVSLETHKRMFHITSIIIQTIHLCVKSIFFKLTIKLKLL